MELTTEEKLLYIIQKYGSTESASWNLSTSTFMINNILDGSIAISKNFKSKVSMGFKRIIYDEVREKIKSE